MMEYKITEIFSSLQGEGSFAGMPAVFVRFAGCNMNCTFCDTEFDVQVTLSPEMVAGMIKKASMESGATMIVLTGGEPLLQDIYPLIDELNKQGIEEIHLETNGSITLSHELALHLMHVTVSPKQSIKETKVLSDYCDDLKLLYPLLPGVGAYEDWKGYGGRRFIQPVDPGTKRGLYENMKSAAAIVQRIGGNWRLGLQIHKIVGLK